MSDHHGRAPGHEPGRANGLFGLALIAVGMPALFWLGFGRVDGFAIGFTAFLVMLAAAVEYLPAAADKAEKRLEGQAPIPPRWFDRLGVVWLLAIPLAPALSWMLRNGIDIDRDNWRWVLGLSAFSCVALPLVCVLPLLRYVRRGTAGIALTILAAGTGFPVVTGAASAYDVIFGPEWQAVEIVRLRDLDYTYRGTRVQADAVFVELADGRTLSRSVATSLPLGAARVLVLRGFGRIIDVQP